MNESLDERKKNLVETLKPVLESLQEGKSNKIEPTDRQIIEAIIGQPACTITPDEARADEDATTSAHYDDWVMSAVQARVDERIQLNSDGTKVEHPTARLLRIGIESIEAGKPSPLFLFLLEQIALRAETHDLLRLVFPEDFPRAITIKQMKAAGDYTRIADEFRAHVKQRDKRNLPFNEIKDQFKNYSQIHPKTIDRALDTHGINFEASRGKNKPK